MADLISREYVLTEYDRQHKGPPGGARKIMEEAPTIDAIPVEWLRRWRDVTDIPLLAMNIDSILKVWEESNKYWGEVNKKQETR